MVVSAGDGILVVASFVGDGEVLIETGDGCVFFGKVEEEEGVCFC